MYERAHGYDRVKDSGILRISAVTLSSQTLLALDAFEEPERFDVHSQSLQ